jgi:glyoxalase superfamily protein
VLRLRGITVNCRNPEGLASFWAAVLGYERRALWEPFAGLKDPSGRDPHLTFQRTREDWPNHIHLDLYADDPEVEAERLEALGASRVRQVEEGDTWWEVLRDPAGNEFCVIAAGGPDRAL